MVVVMASPPPRPQSAGAWAAKLPLRPTLRPTRGVAKLATPLRTGGSDAIGPFPVARVVVHGRALERLPGRAAGTEGSSGAAAQGPPDRPPQVRRVPTSWAGMDGILLPSSQRSLTMKISLPR